MASRPTLEGPPGIDRAAESDGLRAAGSDSLEVKEEQAKEIDRMVRETRRGHGILAKRISRKARIYVSTASVLAGVAAAMVATFVVPTYLVRPAYDNYMVLIFMLVLFPPSLLDVMDSRYKSKVDSKIPDFLRDLAEAQKTGLSFTRALENSAKSNYGILSTELSYAMAKMSWGMTFEEALDLFAKRIDTELAYRVSILLSEVGRSGGKMLEVLDLVYEHIREVISLKRERSRQITPYVMVIYASFGVYIFVVYILFSTFFSQVSNLLSSGAPFGVNVNPETYYVWFFHMAVIEAVIGGMVAGKIAESRSAAGLKHMLVLLAVSFVVFYFFVRV